MTMRARLFVFVHIGMAAVFGSAANTSTAHHDVASANLATDEVEHLMEVAYRTCFGHGDDSAGLQEEAKAAGWKTASASELRRHNSPVSEMIGGWVWSDRFGSFAVMQSKFKVGSSAYLCSITAKLPFDRHDQVKASFERRFAATIAQETERAGKHTDRFLLASPRKSPIDSSIVYVRSEGGLTINMIHGQDAGEPAAWPSLLAAKRDHVDHLMERRGWGEGSAPIAMRRTRGRGNAGPRNLIARNLVSDGNYRSPWVELHQRGNASGLVAASLVNVSELTFKDFGTYFSKGDLRQPCP